MAEQAPVPPEDSEGEYNGWPNYETWAAHLWLTNDELGYQEARSRIEAAGNFDDAAEALQRLVEDANPLADAEPSIYTDLLTYALAGIAWINLAEALAPDEWTMEQPPDGEAGEEPEDDRPAPGRLDDDPDWLAGLPPAEL